MDNIDINQNQPILEIDYTQLMDLRVDFAFKLLFSKGEPRLLISLLNAIFANKKIPRAVKSLTIKNPYMEKESDEDKLSILDIRAQIDDGTDILIEMHMYGLAELKAKTIRSWARAYGEELEVGQNYTDQPPTIVIAFAEGQMKPVAGKLNPEANDKIHRFCMILDCEDFTVFTDAMELHYVDMKLFAKAVNETGGIAVAGTEDAMFSKWLSIITQKEITDKSIIKKACEGEEEISMAVNTLARQGMDKIARQAYQRRKDEIYYYNKNMNELEESKRKLKESEAALAEKDSALAEKDTKLAEKDSALVEKDSALAEKDTKLAEKDAALTEQEKIIAELRSQLEKSNAAQ